ncbi:MAG: hypothetical protein ABSA41_00950 [Terriglobia bacterium]
MPESIISAEQYANIVWERVAALRRLLHDLTRGAPQSAPHRFFRLLRILIDAIDKVFARRCEGVGQVPVPEGEEGDRVVFAARLTMKLLNDVQEQLFPFLEKVDSPHVPVAMLPALQRLADQFESDVELYLFPTSKHNFGFSGFRNLDDTFLKELELYIPDDLRGEIQKQATDAHLPRWFIFLSFPYVVHDSALHITPLLHELGHFADLQLGIYKDLLPIDVSKIEAAKILVDEILQMRLRQREEKAETGSDRRPGGDTRVGQVFQRDVIEQQVFAQCAEIIRYWVHELISDLFALRAGGPAYFYAFVAFAANLGLEAEAGTTHPSPEIRIDFMLKELNELSYFSGDSPESIRSSLEAWKGWIKTRKLDPEGGPERVAYFAIKDNAAKLAEAVRKHSASFSYGTNTFKEKVPAIRSDLEAGIPPIDRPGVHGGVLEPCDFADILNGAWSTYKFSPDKLEGLLDCPDGERKLRATSVLNDLVLKAIEAAEILRDCQKSPRAKA